MATQLNTAPNPPVASATSTVVPTRKVANPDLGGDNADRSGPHSSVITGASRLTALRVDLLLDFRWRNRRLGS
jgi:hypothetical protein